MEKNTKKFYKRKLFWVLIGIGVLIAGGVVFGRKDNAVEFSSSPVKRINLVQSVEETGSIVADIEIEYGWEVSGRVAGIFKKEGDRLKKDELIAALASAREYNNLLQASANLAAAVARLDERLAGPSDEKINESRAAVNRAQAMLAQAEADRAKTAISAPAGIDTAQRAYETAQNNMRLVKGGEDSVLVDDAYDDFLNTLQATIPVLTDALNEADVIIGVDNQLANDSFESSLSALNTNALSQAKNSYREAKSKKISAEQALVVLTAQSAHKTVDDARPAVEDAISAIQLHLIDVQTVLDATRPSANLSQTSLNTYKSGINTAKTNIATERTDITNAAQAVASAKNSLTSYQIALAKAEADLKAAKDQAAVDIQRADAAVDIQRAAFEQAQAAHAALIAKPRAVDVAALRADAASSRAQFANAELEFEKTKLRALADGVLAHIEVEVGENITAQTPVVKIVSSDLGIDVDVSESEIAKVSVDDPVTVTLDAFGSERVLAGRVLSIEPAETELSGVIYYTTHIVLENAESLAEVRPGMTANVRIITETRDSVLVIPQRAVLEEDGQKIVRVVKDGTAGAFEERPVVTGLRGDEGNIEIISGLEEGEEVVTFLKENNSK